MKRKIYYFILSMGLIAGLTGCTGLIDVQPENSTTYTNYFQTRQDAESLLTELLLRMRNGESARKGLGYILMRIVIHHFVRCRAVLVMRLRV
ncbi:MAG: hypothetical protein ACLU4J_14915 [Butyricimonas paravirosa]